VLLGSDLHTIMERDSSSAHHHQHLTFQFALGGLSTKIGYLGQRVEKYPSYSLLHLIHYLLGLSVSMSVAYVSVDYPMYIITISFILFATSAWPTLYGQHTTKQTCIVVPSSFVLGRSKTGWQGGGRGQRGFDRVWRAIRYLFSDEEDLIGDLAFTSFSGAMCMYVLNGKYFRFCNPPRLLFSCLDVEAF
jgi:hypothetical protein